MGSGGDVVTRFAGTRKLAAFAVFGMLLVQPSYAQQFPESSRQKAQDERKKLEQKGTDEAYKDSIKRMPNSDKKVDPWGAVRPSPAGRSN
jgi:hypothetical protein